jgi:hypothetical protein
MAVLCPPDLLSAYALDMAAILVSTGPDQVSYFKLGIPETHR